MSLPKERISQLKAFLNKDEKDLFSRYALAIEYLNIDEKNKARIEFETLLKQQPNYTGAYYHYGKLLEEFGDVEKAESVYQKGIELTIAKEESHMNKELRDALTLLKERNNQRA